MDLNNISAFVQEYYFVLQTKGRSQLYDWLSPLNNLNPLYTKPNRPEQGFNAVNICMQAGKVGLGAGMKYSSVAVFWQWNYMTMVSLSNVKVAQIQWETYLYIIPPCLIQRSSARAKQTLKIQQYN